MARPLKEGLDYFPHDTDASNDERIEMLEAYCGLEGYAVYFKLLERIYKSHNCELDISQPEVRNVIAKRFHLRSDKFLKVVQKCVEVGLFSANDYQMRQTLTSDAIQRRASKVSQERNRMRLKRDVCRQQTIEQTSQQTSQQTTEQTGESKVKVNINKEINKETYNLPDYIDQNTWDAYLEMRKKKKAPPTDRAIELIIKDLESFHAQKQDVNKILEQSIKNNWTGVFELKGNNTSKFQPQGRVQEYERL